MDPKDRALIENDGYEDKEEPTGCDLGEMTLELANSMRSWTFQLEKMVDLISYQKIFRNYLGKDSYYNRFCERFPRSI